MLRLNLKLIFLTMTLACIAVAGTAIIILYQAAFKEECIRLEENAASQASLIAAISRFDIRHRHHDHPGGPIDASISQLEDAYKYNNSFGQSGEFLIGKLENERIHYLFSNHNPNQALPSSVSTTSPLAEPMRRALIDRSNGTLVSRDYRNITVLAAYQPVPDLNLGIVVKMDLAEIRAPFLHAGAMVLFFALVPIALSAHFFFRFSKPIINQIQTQDISIQDYAEQINNANIELTDANKELNREMARCQQMAIALQKSEEHIRLLLNSTSEGIYGLDTYGNCTFINAAALQLLGYEKDSDVLGKNMHNLIHHTDDNGLSMPQDECSIFRAFQSGEKCHNDNELLWRADGTSFASEYWSYPITEQGEIIGAVVTFFDITGRKMAQKKMQTSLDEKETLLKEVHHRVKNNMQIISSLLSLQSQQADNQQTKEAVEICRRRVKTMALIHEKLYRSNNLSEIDFADYLRDLTSDLNHARPQNITNINIIIDAESIFLPVDAAIPCGLIVNELVTNAVKHAFTEKHQGIIRISFKRQDEMLCLTVNDNGQGFPKDFNIDQTDTLGLTLVANLTRQLNASSNYHSNDGFLYSLTFEIDMPERANG